MRYRIVAIGKLKRGFYQTGCAHYLARLGAYASIDLTELKEGKGNPDEVKRREGDALLRASSGHLIALDEHGKRMNTKDLAGHVSTLELHSVSQLSLLIGGAEGHGEVLKQTVTESWSLSPLTLPHDLARLVLLEQLYRLETIRAGHPYHRE